MASQHEQGRKRRPWNVARAIRALEQEVYRIDRDLDDEVARARERIEAKGRLETRSRQVRAGERKTDEEVQLFDRIGPALIELRMLYESRDDPRELRATMAISAKRTQSLLAELAARIESAFGPLQELAEIQARIERAHRGPDGPAQRLLEEPLRLRTAFRRLAAEIDSLSTSPVEGYTLVTDRLEVVRRRVIGDLRVLGYPHSKIAELVDPEGCEEDKAHATDRVRKELDRQRRAAASPAEDARDDDHSA